MMIPPEMAPPGGMPQPPGGGLPPGIDPAALQGALPPTGGPPMGGPPGAGGDPMAALQSLLGAGGGAPGGDPLAALAQGGGPGDGGGDGQLGDLLGNAPQDEGKNPPEIGNWDATDHIRAAIKHLMMAMTNTQDDVEGGGIAKGMAALHGLLASKAKNAKTIAGASPAGG